MISKAYMQVLPAYSQTMSTHANDTNTVHTFTMDGLPCHLQLPFMTVDIPQEPSTHFRGAWHHVSPAELLRAFQDTHTT